jgi:hypothetical protein
MSGKKSRKSRLKSKHTSRHKSRHEQEDNKRDHIRVSRLEHSSRSSSRTANYEMNMTELQQMAKRKGIPFGGLKKAQLVNKINKY